MSGKCWVTSIFCISMLIGYGQENERILVQSNVEGETVQLKWILSDIDIWLESSKKGFNVFRRELSVVNGEQKLGELVKLNDQPIKHVPQDEWQRLVQKDAIYDKAYPCMIVDSFRTSLPSNPSARVNVLQDMKMMFIFAMLSSQMYNKVAQVGGFFFEDKTAKRSREYVYQIEIIGTGYFAQTSVDLDEELVLPQVPGVNLLIDEHKALVEWKTRIPDFEYSYFNIYRSEKKKGPYKKVNDLPYWAGPDSKNNGNLVLFRDSVPTLGEKYYYYVTGVTAFEQEGGTSEIVSDVALRKIRNLPEIRYGEYIDQEYVKIKWRISDEDAPYVKEVYVERSSSPMKGFELITEEPLRKRVRQYEDMTPLTMNYYRVKVVGIAGDVRHSMPSGVQLPDSIPPAPPTGVIATADTNGVVQVSWNKNTEKDLQGYLVYSADDLEQEFALMSKKPNVDTNHVDTVSLYLMNDHIYYRITAIDLRGNQSDYSQLLIVDRPDIVPPRKPIFKSFRSTFEGVQLTWANSSSDDVVEQQLLRKSIHESDFSVRQRFRGDSLKLSAFVDFDTKANEFYTYRLLAIDNVGLVSDTSQAVHVKQRKNPFKPRVKIVNGFSSLEKHLIKISWEYNYPEVNHFVIYRGRGEKGHMDFLKIVPGTKREYYDELLAPNSDYYYHIVAVYKDRTESLPSEKYNVKFGLSDK